MQNVEIAIIYTSVSFCEETFKLKGVYHIQIEKGKDRQGKWRVAPQARLSPSPGEWLCRPDDTPNEQDARNAGNEKEQRRCPGDAPEGRTQANDREKHTHVERQ